MMDCSNILEILDCVRPNSGDLDLPDFDEARAHLTECDSCRGEFESRQQFDRAVATVAQDVPVPNEAALKETLLGVLAAEPAEATHEASQNEAEVTAEAQPASRRKGRWQTRLSLTALACTAAIALIVTWWPKEPEQFSVESLLVRSIADPEEVIQLEEFSGEPSPKHPAGFRHRSLGLGSKFYGYDLDNDGIHDLAITQFKYRSRAFGVTPGVIVAVPVERVTELPTAKDFSRASALYPNPSGFAAAAVTWTDGKYVYFCFVPRRQARALEHLQRELKGTTA